VAEKAFQKLLKAPSEWLKKTSKTAKKSLKSIPKVPQQPPKKQLKFSSKAAQGGSK